MSESAVPEASTEFAVLYTDGGFHQSKAAGGWGVHGYVFNTTAPKVGTGLKDWIVTPKGYVSAKENIGARRKHELWAHPSLKELAEDPKVKNVNVTSYVDMLGSITEGATNNVAELTALMKGLEFVASRELDTVYIFTDSRYAQEGFMSWTVGWEANGWTKSDGGEVANVELWQRLVELKNQIKEKNIALHVEWIKGHAGKTEEFDQDNLGNALADQYATMGCIAATKGESVEDSMIVEAKGYWKPKVEANRMLAHSRWYFNTFEAERQITPDGRYIYHLGDHGKDDDFLGKRMADASFAVVYLKEPEPVMEKVREQQITEDQGNHNSLIIGRMDFIFKPAVYQELLKSGGRYLQRRNRNLDLYTHDKLQITKELRPPRLAFNLIEVMEVMETILNQVLTHNTARNMRVTDITDLIYEYSVKGKKTTCKIKPELTSAVKSLSADIAHPIESKGQSCPVSLTVGMDLPHRNALSALASSEPTVKVVTWIESNQAFRYATVVEAAGDAGIYAGFYSNLHLLTE